MKEAKYLADLRGIKSDLEAAINFCKCLLHIYREEKQDLKLVEPLSIAIIIKYCRPFATGVREKLSIDCVPGLTVDELKEHNNFLALRNKHIAHSVNEFEENEVKAYYNDERVYIDGILKIELGHRKLISISGKEAETIIVLSKKIIDYINLEIKAEKAKLLEIVRTQPIDEILRGGITIFDPKKANVDKRRKQ